MLDAEVASVARKLAQALLDYAYTRKEEDKKRVTACEVELIQVIKRENTNA
jgi:hypothetical protein